LTNPLHTKLTVVSNDAATAEETAVWKILETVPDPEVPVLSILDLGIVRDVQVEGPSDLHPKGQVTITITPTYSGCPAMDAISMDIRLKMIEEGYAAVKIISVLAPAWTTDWMTEAGKQKLAAYGIAPPAHSNQEGAPVICPQCQSPHTKLLSQFGSTACKALYQCEDCKEPFDHFKCH
jgi:ring-1,2-phenylacetyl-CoA epoxidase subunit PaaD